MIGFSRRNNRADVIAANVGEGAQGVAVGKNIVQIGSIIIPFWSVLLLLGVILGGTASTLTQVGDWLLNNVPEMAELLTGLFAIPAVGKVVGKAGSIAVEWVRRRFSAA